MYFTMYDGRVCCVRDAARVSSVRLFARLFVCLSVCLSVCLLVCLSPKCVHKKTRFSHRTKQFRAMVSIHDLQEVLHGIFKKNIIGPLRFKSAILKIVKSLYFNEKSSNVDEIWYTTENFELNDSHVTKYEHF